MKKTKKESTIFGGLFWTFMERISAQLVSTVVTIILARLLDPSHYGVISIVTVFITICNIFVSSGFGSAVIQKKDAEDIDFNTAFVIGLSTSLVLYLVIFIISPYVAKFYNMPELSLIMKIMGLRIPLAALNSIQQAHIQRNMQFQKFFIATFIGTVISAIVGITMAYLGFGVWALVFQYLTNTTIDSIVLLIVGTWKPKLEFSLMRAKKIFSFGWKVLATDLVFTLENDIRSLIVGKVFGPEDLAYFEQGKKYPALLMNNITTSINKVMLPAYSKKQDELKRLKEMLRKSIRIGIFLLAPILIGFALVATDFVSIFLTDKWLPCVPFIQIFCISYLTRPLESSCHQALLAIGKSGLVLFIMIMINGFSLIASLVVVFVFKSVLLLAIMALLETVISLICFMIATNKSFGYKFREQLKDICPTLFISVLMGVGVILISYLSLNKYLMLIIKVFVGAIIYIVLSKLFKVQAFEYLKEKLGSKIKFLHS